MADATSLRQQGRTDREPRIYLRILSWSGRFLGDRNSPNDSEWKICPVCEGSGKMDAEVTIKWKPSKTEKK